MVSKYGSDIIGKAIEQYHRADSIKAMVVAAGILVDETSKVKGEQLIGAQRVVSSFFDALLREMEFARTVTGLQDLGKAGDKIREVAGRVQMQEYSAANKCIGEALSFVTACAQRAVELLKEEALW
ncbi:MAG TPA: hypothetical protein G4O03_07025 [Dehalococcoidia bacterium]|nr:hypothetical protein [Dehalococcoidia bacterium]